MRRPPESSGLALAVALYEIGVQSAIISFQGGSMRRIALAVAVAAAATGCRGYLEDAGKIAEKPVPAPVVAARAAAQAQAAIKLTPEAESKPKQILFGD